MRKYLYVFIFLFIFCHSSYADTNVSKIGVDNVCDGSCDYTTIQAWVTGVAGDFVSAGDIEKGECYDDDDFDESADIVGATTDADNHWWLTSADGEGWVEKGGTDANGVVNDRTTNETTAFFLEDAFTLFENFIVKNGGGTGMEHVEAIGDNITIRNVISRDCPDHPFETDTGVTDTVYINCIAIDAGDDAFQIRPSGASASFYNCLAWGIVGFGWLSDGTTNAVVNCMGFNTSLFVYANGVTNESFNISDDDSAAGTGSVINCVATTDDSPAAGIWVMFENITGGSEDFHLKPAVSEVNEAEGAGTDVSGTTGYDLDMDLETRSVWDIGPDEITVGAPAGITVLRRRIQGR